MTEPDYTNIFRAWENVRFGIWNWGVGGVYSYYDQHLGVRYSFHKKPTREQLLRFHRNITLGKFPKRILGNRVIAERVNVKIHGDGKP